MSDGIDGRWARAAHRRPMRDGPACVGCRWQTGPVLLDELVTTADAVASTRSRLAKVDALADLLGRLEPDEIAPAVGFLVGKPRQGRVGVGWRGVAAAMGEPAAEPTLTVADLDELLDRLAARAGAGSAAERARALRELTARATEREQGFLGRVLLGDMRTGALEGVVTDAVARAADRPGDVGAPRGDAVGRPRRDRAHSPSPATADRARRGRARRRAPGAADARGHRREPVRGASRRRARHPSNTSSTARASRCIARATTCACSPATSPTSRTGCPRSSRSCSGCRCTT